MPDIVHAVRDGVHYVTLNRPGKLNALTDDMMNELPRLVREISSDPKAVAIVLTGEGRAFCSGADLSLVAQRQELDRRRALPEPVGREVELLRGCEVPLISVVNGVAAGAGMWLACASDFRVMEAEASFLEAHVSIGVTPTAMCWLLPRLIGHARANEIILTGRRVGAEEALELGLVTTLAEVGDGMGAAQEIIDALREMPSHAVRATRSVMQMSREGAPLDHLRATGSYLNRMSRLSGESVGIRGASQ